MEFHTIKDDMSTQEIYETVIIDFKHLIEKCNYEELIDEYNAVMGKVFSHGASWGTLSVALKENGPEIQRYRQDLIALHKKLKNFFSNERL